jgi:hypothetical protein
MSRHNWAEVRGGVRATEGNIRRLERAGPDGRQEGSLPRQGTPSANNAARGLHQS